MEKRTIANVITAAIWIGSLIFLIWFCVVQFQRLKHTSVVTTSFSNPEAITYPGLFVCPSTETVIKTNATLYPSISVGTGNGATFQPFKPYDSNVPDLGYTVCPRYVYFQTPDASKTIGCIDFQPRPVFNLSATQASLEDKPFCPTDLEQAYWFKNSTAVPDPLVAPWTASRIGNGMYVDLNSEGVFYEPYMMLLYSDRSRLQPPTSFAEYQAIFSLTNFFLAHIPLMSFVALNIDKVITDNWPVDTSCNYEGFLSAVSLFNLNPVPPGDFRYSSFLMGFDILEEVTTCHSPVVGGTDVLGIVGGGIALVLAVTIGFQLLVQKLLGGGSGNTGSHGDTSVQSYRPLSGE